MMGTPLDQLPLWGVFLATLSALILTVEIGYQIGGWRFANVTGEKEGPVNATVGSILGLLAIILAFTFGFAATRYENRRDAVLQEANAIGTSYLRARLLPEPQRSEVQRYLREYVDVRIQGVQTGKLDEAIARSLELQNKLWELGASAADRNDGSIMVGLFIQSLNQLIDLHTVRITAGIRSRIPITIWVSVFGLALLGAFAMGYQAGLSATRRSPTILLMGLATAIVLYLIVDLDRAQEGFMQISQQSMLDLQKSISSAPK